MAKSEKVVAVAEPSVVEMTSHREVITIPPPNKKRMTVTIVGDDPVIVHAWNTKAREQIEAGPKGSRIKTVRGPVARNPEEECEAAFYRMESGGTYCLPAMAPKLAMISACRGVQGVPMSVARQAFFILADGKDKDGTPVVEIRFKKAPWMREDIVRLSGPGRSPDMRYRPQFDEWSMTLRIEFNANVLSIASVLNLLNEAGAWVGIGERRPETEGNTFGRFHVANEEEAA